MKFTMTFWIRQRISRNTTLDKGDIMSREKKNNHPVTLRMDAVIYDKLNEYCKETGLSKTVAIERAVEMFSVK